MIVALFTAHSVVALPAEKFQNSLSNSQQNSELGKIASDIDPSVATTPKLGFSQDQNNLNRLRAVNTTSAGDNTVSDEYCYSCSGCSPNYGCQDCGGIAYCCCSGYNICCGSQSYCASSCDGSYYYDDDDSTSTCFAENTIISYKDKHYTLPELLAGKEPECTVPHVVRTKGGILKTDCGNLELTGNHLVWINDKFTPAQNAETGDSVLRDDGKYCTVIKYVPKGFSSEHFGVNCLESEIFANGFKASPFEYNHEVPSAFLKVFSQFVGIKAASYMGNALMKVVGPVMAFF